MFLSLIMINNNIHVLVTNYSKDKYIYNQNEQ